MDRKGGIVNAAVFKVVLFGFLHFNYEFFAPFIFTVNIENRFTVIITMRNCSVDRYCSATIWPVSEPITSLRKSMSSDLLNSVPKSFFKTKVSKRIDVFVFHALILRELDAKFNI